MFELDERVKTPFGDEGLVSMLGVDDGGNIYYVKTKDSSNWFKEGQLKGFQYGFTAGPPVELKTKWVADI